MLVLDDFKTIKQGREELFQNYGKGVRCPCCNQHVKLYKRKLTSSMAYALILVYWYFNMHPETEWLHVEDYLKSLPDIPSAIRGDFPKLRYWGLLEKKGGKTEDKNPRVGFYKITEKGIGFIQNKLRVPKDVYLYNNELKGYDDEYEINIKQALESKFNYEELMQSVQKNDST